MWTCTYARLKSATSFEREGYLRPWQLAGAEGAYIARVTGLLSIRMAQREVCFERSQSSGVALTHFVLPAKKQPHLALVLCRVRADANEQTAVVWRRGRVGGQTAEVANERRRLAV